MSYFFILLFMILSFIFVCGGLFASRLLAPRNLGRVKNASYECGEKAIGPSWIQFNVGYYLFALLFLVFDVESAFLFPWAVVLKEVGVIGLLEGGLFMALLLTALIYAWKKGDLAWV